MLFDRGSHIPFDCNEWKKDYELHRMLACGERLDRSSVWVLGVTWGKGEERSEKGRRLNLFPLSPPSSKIYSPLTPKEGPILCLLRLENFRNMRLSPDPQIFSAPDLKPSVGKIQNRRQWKHIVIHVSINWSDLRATCARVWGGVRMNVLCPTLRPPPKPGDCTRATIVQYPGHCYHRYEKIVKSSRTGRVHLSRS